MSHNVSGARRAVAVTTSDTAVIGETRAIYVGGDGNLAVKLAEDSAAVTFVGVVAGTVLPLQAKVVMATNTTATNIVALY